MLNHLLDGNLCKNFFHFNRLYFHVVNYDFVISIYIKHIAASNAETDDVLN